MHIKYSKRLKEAEKYPMQPPGTVNLAMGIPSLPKVGIRVVCNDSGGCVKKQTWLFAGAASNPPVSFPASVMDFESGQVGGYGY